MPVNVDSKILSALRAAEGRAVASTDLAEKLQLSRSTLSRQIDELRSLGYEIESSPHHGYRLLRGPEVLHAEDLLARLGPVRVIGRTIRVFQETTSTNDVVERFARDGVQEGIVVFAESQSRGRGRLGRKWISPAGKGLWLSVLLRPALRLDLVTQLTIVSATALTRAIRSQTDLRPEIKWPNDVLIRGKKVAGILMELSAELDSVKHVVLGIGVDVNMSASDLSPELAGQATSLQMECGHPLDRTELAATILRELDRVYHRLISGGFEGLADEWESQCTTLGREVTIQMGGREVRGRAESLDPSGALLLRTHHGHLERISGGDVSLAK